MEYDILINKDNHLDENYYPLKLYTLDKNENNFHKALNPYMQPCLEVGVVPYFVALREAAKKEGYNLIVDIGFRSYAYQNALFKNSLAKNGLKFTLNSVAIPGCSEHQTGLALDIAYIKDGVFIDDIKETDEEYKWLEQNAYKYGFILRYPKNKEKITGYKFEPWHYRFVGIPLATLISKYHLTLEEYHQRKDQYQEELETITNPNFKTYLEFAAALLLIKQSFTEKELMAFINQYHECNPQTLIIPSSLEYLLNIDYSNGTFYLTIKSNLLELRHLSGDELLEFNQNHLVLSR